MLPTFLVIGAMKSGTTSFAHYLGSHPQVFMTEDKEPEFFSRQDKLALGLDWYASLFDDAGEALARGEASTGYTRSLVFPGVPERIAAVLPDVRLLYLVRHPIERIRSHYLHQALRGLERRPLTTVLAEDGARYVSASRYSMQLDGYLEFFDPAHILVLTSDQLRTDPVRTMARAYEFVGVQPWAEAPVEAERNVTASTVVPKPGDLRLQRLPGRRVVSRIAPAPVRTLYRRFSMRGLDPAVRAAAQLPPDVVRSLEERLAEDVAGLRRLLGPEFDGWGIA